MCTHRPPQAVSCHHFGAGCSCFSTTALHASLSLLHKLLPGFPSFQHFCISSPTTPLLHIAVQTSGYLLAHKLVESFHFCRQSTHWKEKVRARTFGQLRQSWSPGADLKLPTCLLTCYCLPQPGQPASGNCATAATLTAPNVPYLQLSTHSNFFSQPSQ